MSMPPETQFTKIQKTLPKSSLQHGNKKYQRFLNLLNEQKHHEISKTIKNYYGKNFPVDYRKQYGFFQQWQSKQMGHTLSDQNLLEQLGFFYIFYCVLTMISSVFSIWAISVQRYFNTDVITTTIPIYSIMIILNLIDVSIKCYIKYTSMHHFPSLIFIFQAAYRNLILILYFLIMIVIYPKSEIIYPIQMVIMYFLYKRGAQIYKYIKVMEFGLHYQNYVKIFDLLFNIFIQAHIFAVLLFLSSKIEPDNSWISSAGIENATFLVKYANSIYFACTTMLTIGYGDITPKSVGEKLVTIGVQIVGVIAFGYLLNQMGHTLSKMREQSAVLERDLQTISKISKYYNLQTKLQNKAKNFILTNQRQNESLKIEDQNKLLLKLNEDLRQEINLQNSLNVVKSCIFYICHWSKEMQTEIARRLQKRMFAPNQKLVISNSTERVFIVKKGKVDIYMNRYGESSDYRKILKTIDTDSSCQLQVSDNIYSYTTVFSNRPFKLLAIAKDFTSTYSVTKQDFLECIKKNYKDFQYYHQIKCRVDQSVFCEQWQAPAIKNTKQHYIPSHIVLIKKQRRKNIKNNRKFTIRGNKKKYQLIQGFFNKTRLVQDQMSLGQHTIEFTSRYLPYPKEKTGTDHIEIQYTSQDEENDKIESVDSIEKSHHLAVIKIKTFQKDIQQKQNVKLISSKFQQNKEYFNFFRLNNISRVLHSLQKLNFIETRLGDLKGSQKQIKNEN